MMNAKEIKSNRDWRLECESLRQQLAEVDDLYKTSVETRAKLRGELAELRQAVGLATTLAGHVEVDVNNPLKMMQEIVASVTELRKAQGEPVNQYRKRGCSDWYDGHPDNDDGNGPYEVRTLYTSPVVAQSEPDAWLFTGRKPGNIRVFASVDPSDTQTWPTDDGYTWIKEPLYV